MSFASLSGDPTHLSPLLRLDQTDLSFASVVVQCRPAKVPQAMGYSVRTTLVRYTEWRDWRTGEVMARELYDAANDAGEMCNVLGSSDLAAAQAEAEVFLRKTFPAHKP